MKKGYGKRRHGGAFLTEKVESIVRLRQKSKRGLVLQIEHLGRRFLTPEGEKKSLMKGGRGEVEAGERICVPYDQGVLLRGAHIRGELKYRKGELG